MGVVSVCATASAVYIFNLYRVYTCIYLWSHFHYYNSVLLIASNFQQFSTATLAPLNLLHYQELQLEQSRLAVN